MKNMVVAGTKIKNLTATGAVVSGTVYKYQNALFVAIASAATSEAFAGYLDGEFSAVPKTGGQVWTQGQALYWSGTAFTTTVTGSAVGWAGLAALSGDTTGQVVLAGVPAT